MEFEDATPASVFVAKRGRSTPEWSPRFDRGFSQIIDWFLILDDQKRTGPHKKMFDADLVEYIGLLVVGRLGDLDGSQRERMVWRSERVSVAGHQVNCITFDELYETFDLKIKISG